MFFSELKVLLLMRSGSGSSRRTDTGTDPDTQTRMRGLAIGGCGWPPLSCSHRDDEEEYYGSDPRPRSLAFEDNEGAKPQGGGLDAASLPSLSESGTRSPQCRICFQGPEKVWLNNTGSLLLWVPVLSQGGQLLSRTLVPMSLMPMCLQAPGTWSL